MSDPLKPRTLAAFALAAALGACGGGSNPFGNPPSVENPPGVGGQKLSFAYFQKLHLSDLPGAAADPPGQRQLDQHLRRLGLPRQHQRHRRVLPGHRRNAAVVDVTDPANTPDLIRATDMYKNFYSARGDRARLADPEPPARQAAAVKGCCTAAASSSTASTTRCQADRLLDQPPDAGRARTSSARPPTTCSRRADPEHRHVQHPMNGLAWGRAGLRVACLAAMHRPGGAGARRRRAGAGERRRPSGSDHRPVHRAAHRPGSRLSGVLRRRRAASGSTSSCATPTGIGSRTAGGKVGWVHRGQLETTLTASGAAARAFATSCSTTT